MTHSPISHPSALDSLLSQSTGGMRKMDCPTTCCCGQTQCAYLLHNNTALEGLEKDLRSAAQIGQALLARHEAYMAEAEEERRRMGASIEKLERDKMALEITNTKTIDENRYLLDQLEELNNTVAVSDAQILALNGTLRSTRKEFDRLKGLAAQAEHLEAQLTVMEAEQYKLQEELDHKEEDERSAIQRWKGAERTINELAEQVDRIEKEAREERLRHVEVVARFERRSAMERELQGAAGSVKSTATRLGRENGNVVSHFVKDILQDNVNLQSGIVELREMLIGSNEEVEKLREQMMLHQPAHGQAGKSTKPFLDSELAEMSTKKALPEFHLHHHYHAAPRHDASKEKQAIRRPKKRRNITSPPARTPVSGVQSPRTPYTPRTRPIPPSSAATILSQTSVTIPPLRPSYAPPNWFVQSSHAPSSIAPSSLPSSPQLEPSIFDVDDALNSSRPTTPDSTNFGSPDFRLRYSNQDSDVPVRSLATQYTVLNPQGSCNIHQSAEDFPFLDHSTILEEPEDSSISRPPPIEPPYDYRSPHQTRPHLLHRASSHESILSPHGIDGRDLVSKRTLLRDSPRPSLSSLGASSASIMPVTSSTSAVAQASRSTRDYNSSSYHRYLLANVASPSPTTHFNHDVVGDRSTFGKRVGGWITGRWGVAPTSSSSNDGRSSASRAKGATREGDQAVNRLSTHVEAMHIDSALLEETLGQG